MKRTNKCEKEEKQQKGVGGETVVEDTLNVGWSVNSSYGLVMCTPTMGRQQRAVSEGSRDQQFPFSIKLPVYNNAWDSRAGGARL